MGDSNKNDHSYFFDKDKSSIILMNTLEKYHGKQ